MAEFAATCDTTEGVMVHLHPHSAATATAPAGEPVALVGVLEIVKESGDGDFRFDATDNTQLELISGPAAGVSVITATGKDAAGNSAMDRYTLTVTQFVEPLPPLAELGSVLDAPIKK